MEWRGFLEILGTATGKGKEIEVTNAGRTLEEIVIDTSGTKQHHFEKLQIAKNFIIVFLKLNV